jgi:hypothetical protein
MTITGVIGINDKRVQWLVEDIFNNGINIDYLTHIQERREELEAEGVDEDEIESMIENEEYEGGTCVLGYILDPESDPLTLLSAGSVVLAIQTRETWGLRLSMGLIRTRHDQKTEKRSN